MQGSLAGEVIRQSLNLTVWSAAQDKIRNWEAGGEIGAVHVQVPTIAEAVAKYLADCEARGLKEPSLKKYRLFLERQFLHFCQDRGYVRLKQLTVEVIRDFRGTWQGKFSPVTQSKRLETLRGFLRFCESANWIRGNPSTSVKPPRINQTPTLPFTEAEFERLLAAADQFRGKKERMRAMLLLLRHSGLRIGDAVSLQKRRVTDNKLFLYTAKTGTPVHLPLPDSVIKALQGIGEGEYFFWTGKSKLKTTLEAWRRAFESVATKAKVENAHFHRLRDTFAVSLLEKGVPLETVSVLLGHSSIRVTERHYRPWVKTLQDKLESEVRGTWT